MKTKYFIMMVVAVLMGTQVMNAQDNEQGKKRSRKRMTMEQMVDMQSRKIIGDLGLDDKTAARFTDVYAKYMKEMNDLRKEYMPKRPEAGKKPSMPTDAEVDKMMRDRFKQSRKMLDIREKYYDEFRKFLSPKQVQKIYDQGQMNHGKFHKEMNRRAGMKRPMEGPRQDKPQK
ncbi:MAG: DUF3826 domain-containing protein [Bacteroidaceae bacterium]|nr:DUF3826 domain-containing protein [Bacteroidaceae bacterium]